LMYFDEMAAHKYLFHLSLHNLRTGKIVCMCEDTITKKKEVLK